MNELPPPAVTSRREFLIGGALLATGAASAVLARTPEAVAVQTTALERQVPLRIGGWRFAPSSSVPIPEGEGAGDQVYDQLVSRHYDSDSDLPIMLLVAYGGAQSGSTQLHRPEVCYPAAGFRISDRPDIALRLPHAPPITARALTGIAPGRTEQIMYWSRVGGEFPTDSVRQRWSVLRQTVTEGVPDGALVRISTIVSDEEAGWSVLRRFAAALLNASGPELRRVIVGVS